MVSQFENAATEALSQRVEGYIYPNELSLLWGDLIVLYPYITGLVAGAFILASLVRVFNVKALEPTYRLALLTSLAFLLAAPLPLLFHLGHPERSLQVMITPHLSSPMAIFGFVYAWYLMAVLLLELWFDYRKDFVLWSRSSTGLKRWFYGLLTLGVLDISEESLKFDDRVGRVVTIIGIPSAFILHGYVGFIFGSVKANPWWGNVLMPIIFIFSAIVSGIALCLFLFMVISQARRLPMDMQCLDATAKFLFYTLIVAAAIESLDWVHRLYEAEESIHIIKTLATGKLFVSIIVIQGFLGSCVPLVLLGLTQIFKKDIAARAREWIYFLSSILILIGVLAMRWNVVIGGQLFSKSLRGFTTYKMEIAMASEEGFFMSFALVLLILPFCILWVFLKLFLPVKKPGVEAEQSLPIETSA